MSRRSMAAWVAAALMFATPAGAAVLYDSGDPIKNGANCYCNDQFFAGAVSFPEAATITDIEAVIFGTGTATVSVHANSPDDLPGAVLFSADFSLDVPQGAADWFGLHGLSWDLGPGRYWFAFTVDFPTEGFVGGILAGAPKSTEWAIDRGPAHDWESLGRENITLRVSGTGGGRPVPEPGAWALMILGFGTAGAALRRCRFAAAA